jgi:hypothetical protein
VNRLKGKLLHAVSRGVFAALDAAAPGSVNGYSGWAFYDMSGFPQWWHNLTNPDKTFTATVEDGNKQYAGVEGFVLPLMEKLISDFDPEKWTGTVDRLRRGFYRKTPHSYPKPEHLVWLQVYLLDAELQRLLRILSSAVHHDGPLLYSAPTRRADEREGDNPECSNSFSMRIIRAIWKAWPRSRSPLEMLEADIMEEIGVLKDGPDQLRFYVRQLSDLVKLRALFFAAFMMVIPDSSDLLRFQQRRMLVELPMI